MKKNRIRAVALALVICLLGCCAAESGITKETWYSAGLAALEEMSAESLSDAVESFQAAGSYLQSQNYKQYALSLKDIV